MLLLSDVQVTTHHVAVIRRKSTHGWSTLELLLPLFNQGGGLTQALDLVALTVRHFTCQRVSSCGRIFDGMPQCSQAVVDQCLRPGVLIGNASGSFPVGVQVFLGLLGFAFEFRGLLPRPPCLGTNRFVTSPTVTHFPEGAAQFCICCFVCGPAVRELLGSSGQIFAGAVQFVL